MAQQSSSAYKGDEHIVTTRKKNDKYCPPTNMEDKPAELIDFQAFIKAENLYNEFLEMATKIFISHHDMVLQ
uniref:Uncharacterized protein n=1 Tax=Romanomermis culicivorax TaxID=13658 RepID=A0A915I2J7_ROMCU